MRTIGLGMRKLCDQPATDDAFSSLQRPRALACATRGSFQKAGESRFAAGANRKRGFSLETSRSGGTPGEHPGHSTLDSNSIHLTAAGTAHTAALLHSVVALIMPARDSVMDAMLKIRVRI